MSLLYWSGRRDSNPRPPPWQGDVLPLNYFRSTFISIAKHLFIESIFLKKIKKKKPSFTEVYLKNYLFFLFFKSSCTSASTLSTFSGRIVGKSKTSRIAGASVKSITKRSIPIPKPPVGGIPNSIARR